VHLIYNILNPDHLIRKTNYHLSKPPRIISVGRQFKEKNPENIIRAMKDMDVHLTLVGDGLYHEKLRALVHALDLTRKIQFIKAIPNDDLCERLREYDLFVSHCDYWGIPKALLEPLLVGLPVVINRRRPEPNLEMNGDWVRLVENTEKDYRQAIDELLANHTQRAALGQRGYTYAHEHFAPERSEQLVKSLYQEYLS
jgi:glycosyltransferase involved in cell wall biosynthesis